MVRYIASSCWSSPMGECFSLPKVGKSTFSQPSYYLLTFILQSANFVPFFYITFGLSLQRRQISLGTLYWFTTSCLLAVPLIFEFALDTVVSAVYSSYLNNVLEHRFGHSMLLLSLALPAIIVVSDSRNSHFDFLFGSCFIDCCQILAVSAIYGKLQVFGKTEWGMKKALTITVLFLGAQLSSNFGIGLCSGEKGNADNEHCPQQVVGVWLSIAFLVLCLAFHVWFSRSVLHDLYAVCFQKPHESLSITSNQYTCCVLIVILIAYFLARILTFVSLLSSACGLEATLNAKIATHIALTLCGAILPGRMIRRGMVALKVSILNILLVPY